MQNETEEFVYTVAMHIHPNYKIYRTTGSNPESKQLILQMEHRLESDPNPENNFSKGTKDIL